MFINNKEEKYSPPIALSRNMKRERRRRIYIERYSIYLVYKYNFHLLQLKFLIFDENCIIGVKS